MHETATAERHGLVADALPRGGASFGACLACMGLSGFAALLYQTAWMRQFSVAFGTSELAVVSVLAAFMAGLAGGSIVAGRAAARIARPLRIYGLLELGIAGGALLVPFLIQGAHALQVAVQGRASELVDSGGILPSLLYVAIAFAVLALPTALMGATLPILTLYAVRREEEIGRRVGALYAANTAGAVAGALMGAFVLLPRLGLRSTVLVGVGANVLVFAIAALASRRERAVATAALRARRSHVEHAPAGATRSPTRSATAKADAPRSRTRVLPLMLVSGAASFTYEVLWTRLFGHVLGGSLVAFAAMLAAFLSGIAIGGAVAAKLAGSRARAASALATAQFATALVSALLYANLDALPFASRALAGDGNIDPAARVALAVLVLLPAAISIGATFPFAVRVLARDEEDAAPAAARVYGWNTLGAIVGAVGAGLFLLPALGFSGAIRLAVAINAALGAASLFLVPARLPLRVGACLAAVAIALAFRPDEARSILYASPIQSMPVTNEIFFSVGRSATVLVAEGSGTFELRSNGLSESIVTRAGGKLSAIAQEWLGALPALARPGAEDWLVIGLGGGVLLQGVPPSAKRIDVIELEPEVIAANRAIAGLRAGDPLADPRLHIAIGDARGALDLTTRRWDVIVSQPSHPWTAGASHLYTREFLALAREHLAEGGVFLQWVNGDFMSPEDLRVQCATVLSEFAHVRLYQPYSTMLVLLASAEPLDVERRLVASGEPLASEREHFARLGLRNVEHAAALLLLDEEGVTRFGADSPPNTDDRNRLASPRLESLGTNLERNTLVALTAPFDALAPEVARSPRPHAGPIETLALDRGTVAQQLAARGAEGRALRVAAAARDVTTARLAAARVQRVLGRARETDELVLAVLAEHPLHPEALYLQVEPWLAQLEAAADGTNAAEASGRPRAPAAIERAAERVSGFGALVIRGWRLANGERWSELALLDGELAQRQPTDLHDAAALHLRILWRLGTPDPVRAREAFALAEELFAYRPNESALFLRFEAALAADVHDAVLETAWQLEQVWSSSNAGAVSAASHAKTTRVLRALEARRGDRRLDPKRTAELLARLTQLLAKHPPPGSRGN